MPELISLQATPLATTRQVAFQLRRDTSGIQNILKPQNIEQGISNVEVTPSSFCGSLFDIRYSMF